MEAGRGGSAPSREAPIEFSPGDRVELVATSDPYTRLRPGDRGTVTSVTDTPEPTVEVQWDTGSTLAVLPNAGDRIRLLPRDDAGPPPSPPASGPPTPEDPTQPRYPEVQVRLLDRITWRTGSLTYRQSMLSFLDIIESR